MRPAVIVTLALVAAVAVSANVADAKRCVFVHGSGESPEGPPTTTDTSKYWGDMAEYTPQCSSYVYTHDDTVTQRFDDKHLMQHVCEGVVGTDSLASNSVVTDSIVFTHSMGNLMLAAAVRDGVCSFDSSSSWYMVNGPMEGSKAADFAAHICANNSTIGEAIRKLAEDLHYCRADDPSQPNEAYVSMATTYPGLKGVKEALTSVVKGGICGVSPFGLTSKYSLLMSALSDFVHYGEQDDGMVGLSSCLLAGKSFGTSFEDDFYQAEINHPDGTCRDGDGDFGNAARQPCKWFSHRS